ncbi:MAG: SoxR reducing system RseC family protein [Bacillota bacterium]|jgi:sigma-E factor negative regulatory protein RseC|nr:SoxR reducing system RseC family protein [Bacillota bacterium]MDD3297816.1 SoxR reducing system RseC family protein [Bacillota bacterium]MDD3850817.1 SoxR reducing system RseC family protein [Bacillota bacterium]MDD4707511.1 SoxR reducing system RseC family protein [Bacillota bacterium]
MGKVHQVGIVRKVKGNRVDVEIARTGSCGENCAGCKLGCSGTGITVQLDNPVNARVGDIVRIQAAGGGIATIAAFTYLLPLIMMVVGMVYGGKLMHRLYPGMDANLTGLVFGVTALILFYFILKMVGGRLAHSGRNRPRIVDIINR